MNDIQQLEMLSESIKNEIDELESLLQHSDKSLLKAKKTTFQNALQNIISNLESTNDSIYGVFEELNANNNSEELRKENEILKEILSEKLTYDEKLYFQIRYHVEIY